MEAASAYSTKALIENLHPPRSILVPSNTKLLFYLTPVLLPRNVEIQKGVKIARNYVGMHKSIWRNSSSFSRTLTLEINWLITDNREYCDSNEQATSQIKENRVNAKSQRVMNSPVLPSPFVIT